MWLKLLPFAGIAIAAALAIFFWNNWQNEVKKTGDLNRQLVTCTDMNSNLNKQIKEENAKTKSTATSGAVSYGQCQDIMKSNATVSFDKGVLFGRATCANH